MAVPARLRPPPTLNQDPPPGRAATLQRGLSLRPRDAISDAVNPYRHGRLTADRVGIRQLSVWCPTCDYGLEVFEVLMVPAGLYVEGVCFFCGNRPDQPGIVKRLYIPLASGQLPEAEE